MGYSDPWETVVMDAGPFFRFDGHLLTLLDYLREKATITREVERELQRNAQEPEYSFLKAIDFVRGIPVVKDLSPASAQELTDLLGAARKPGEHELEHAGEVASVLLAVELAPALVVVDDRDGKALTKRRRDMGAKIERIGSVQLAAEMVVAGALTRDEGLGVFRRVLAGRTDVTDADFDRSIKQVPK